MNLLTAALYGALAVYLGGWYFDLWFGNFPLLLFILSVVTGVYWLAERYRFKPEREAAVRALDAQDAQRRTELARRGIEQVDGDLTAAREKLLMQPWWLDWTAGLFPVIAAVFLMRSFLFEPFKIPSGSMIPTLQIGDLILVSKFHYGIRLPVLNTLVVETTPLHAATWWCFTTRWIPAWITSGASSACPVTRCPTSTPGCRSTAA